MRDRIQRGWSSPGWINYLLLPVTWIYLALTGIRKLMYRYGVFATGHLDAPVIVVGGISSGGSGKTPLVIALARYLHKQGYRPGIISRGYGGNSAYWPRQVDQATTAEMVGDEPQLMYELAGVPVVVGPDRIADGRQLLNDNGCDVVVSDDGFQHFRLHRDLDIVVIDPQAGFGNGWCLPSGPLREPVSALERAGMIVKNGNVEAEGALPGALSGSLSMSMTMNPGDCYNLITGESRDLASFSGSKVNAVAGIGNPERFFRQLEQTGIELQRHPFPDHYRFLPSDLEFTNDGPVLMTEKDGIKCRAMEIKTPVWIVRANVDLDPDFYTRIDEFMNQPRDPA